jgi:hypothetical protein
MEPHNPATRTITSDRSPATATVDNLLRRSLKISKPDSPEEMAKGLLARYPEEAAKIKREQLGVPFSVMAAPTVITVAPTGVGRPEVRTANEALERALTQLTTSPDLADVAPEMRGWATTIRRAAADGFAAATFAIDASERDRAFAARRMLGEYARLARYAAAINACATEIYCRLAQACDLAANVILVLIGDALGDAGVTRAGAVIQVPTATLQSRRDALVVALRNLLQIAPTGDQNTWPRGTVALGQIYRGLELAGAPDLRALLDESYLSRQVDDLIDLATGSTPDGLRALGSTATVVVQRLQRFFILANGMVRPPSPPATTFFAELRLFVDSFTGGNAGYRLPFLARSPLLVSGLASMPGGVDAPTQILLTLALERTALADAIDCLCCTCNQDDTRDLVLAGLILSRIDRAIDLYAIGTHPLGLGDAEWSAAAYGALALCAFRAFPPVLSARNRPVFARFLMLAQTLRWVTFVGNNVLSNITLTAAPNAQAMRAAQLAGVVNTMIEEELRWSHLISTIAPLCRQNLLFPETIRGTGPGPFPTNPIGGLLQLTTEEIARQVGGWGGFIVPRPEVNVRMPADADVSLNIIARDDLFDPPDPPNE